MKTPALLALVLVAPASGAALAQALPPPAQLLQHPVAPNISPQSGPAQTHAAATSGGPAKGSVILTLPDAVLIGLRRNRAIRTEYLQRIADRFALQVANDAFTPRITLDSSFTRSRTQGISQNNININPALTWTLPTGATVTGGLTTTQTNTAGQVGNGNSELSFQILQPLLQGCCFDIAGAPVRVAHIQEKINKLTLKQTVIDNVTQIITAYRSLIEAQEQQRIAEEALKRARVLLETNQILIAAGRLAAVEIVQSQASIAQQELAVATARDATDTARLALLAVLALDPASQIVTVDKLTTTPVGIDENKALAIAFARQPAYLSQLLTNEISKINLEVAKNQRLWNISLLAGAGKSANANGIFQGLQELHAGKLDYTAGVQISIPIFNPTLPQGEVNATVALRQGELLAAQLHDQTEQQVRNAVRTVLVQDSQLATAKRSRELSAAQLDIELTKLQVGRSSNFEVVSFQNDLQQAQSAELSAIIAYLNALTTLDQVLGTTLDTWHIDLHDE